MSALDQLAKVWLLARRELSAYLHAPLGYIVAVLFALLQGFSFWYLVSALADPSQPAPLSAALAGHFGGSVLSVTALVVVVAAIAMRLVAEDKRQGTWEALLTTPVSEGAVIVGKWLGGSIFFALLWLPSALYPLILAHYAAPTASLDPGPIAAALLGVMLLGGALLALGVAASTATSNQIVAALATTVIAFVWILLGDIPDIAPQLAADWPTLSAVIEHLSVRAYLDQLARGVVPVRALALHLGTIVLGLACATALAVAGRRRAGELWRRGLAIALLAISVVCGNILSARHPANWDVTRARINSLAPRMRTLLDQVGTTLEPDERVEITVVRAGLDIFVHLQGEVDRLLDRMVKAQPALALTRIDPALQPGEIGALAAEFAIPVENLRDGGLVVFQRGARRRAVDIWDVADFQTDDLGVGHLSEFRAQSAFAQGLAEVMDAHQPVVCYTTGHGELSMDPNAEPLIVGRDSAPDWADIAHKIERDGAGLVAVPVLAAGVPGHCQVLIMAGPRRPLSASAVRALGEFSARGGGLLLALTTSGDRQGRSTAAGTELLLAEFGIGVLAAEVIDPSAALTSPSAWFTTTGYGRHPITLGFAQRRATVWLRPRALTLQENTDTSPAVRNQRDTISRRALVMSSSAGYGETTPAALGPARRDDRDIAGPLAVAVAAEDTRTGARIVVLGSAESVSSQITATHGSAGDLLVQRSVAWLHGRRLADPATSSDANPEQTDESSALEQMRLLMTGTQLTGVFVLCVGVMPVGFALVGMFIWWRRRRA